MEENGCSVQNRLTGDFLQSLEKINRFIITKQILHNMYFLLAKTNVNDQQLYCIYWIPYKQRWASPYSKPHSPNPPVSNPGFSLLLFLNAINGITITNIILLLSNNSINLQMNQSTGQSMYFAWTYEHIAHSTYEHRMGKIAQEKQYPIHCLQTFSITIFIPLPMFLTVQ